MFLYITVILIAIVLVSLGNLLFVAAAPSLPLFWHYFRAVSGGAVAVIAVDGIFAFCIRRLTPSSWFAPDRKAFGVSKSERDFYKKLRIKAWKDKIPELGGFTGFHKNHLASVEDKPYLSRFLSEANYGVIIHLSNALFGFLIVLLPFCRPSAIWIPIFAVNFILSLLPVAVLRYTSYTLQKLYKRSCERGTREGLRPSPPQGLCP